MLNIIFVRTNACSQNSKGLMLRTTWSYSPIWEGAIIYLIWKKEHKIFSNIILFAVLQPRQKREFSLYPQQASIFNIQKRMSDTIDRNPTKYWSSLGSLAGTEEVELLIYKVGYTLPINRLCCREDPENISRWYVCTYYTSYVFNLKLIELWWVTYMVIFYLLTGFIAKNLASFQWIQKYVRKCENWIIINWIFCGERRSSLI